jgi:uncharacterized protein (TIGR02271 family)
VVWRDMCTNLLSTARAAVERGGMENEWFKIVDAEGCEGWFRNPPADLSIVEVKLETGQLLTMPRAYVRVTENGSFRFDRAFSELLAMSSGSEAVIPVIEEELEIGKRSVPRERVRVRTSVSTHDEVVDLPLTTEELRVERVPIGRTVDAASTPEQRGDTLIIPVYEEVLFVEKRLVLREEVHVTRARREEHAPQRVTLRKEEVAIERTPLTAEPATDQQVQSRPGF